jgi:hypothetical protein
LPQASAPYCYYGVFEFNPKPWLHHAENTCKKIVTMMMMMMDGDGDAAESSCGWPPNVQPAKIKSSPQDLNDILF